MEKVLSTAEIARAKALQVKLNANLPRRLRLWVKDPSHEAAAPSSSSSSSSSSGGEPAAAGGSAEDFSIEVTAVTPVETIREVVREKAAQMMTYDEELDGALQLTFDGALLEDGKAMGDYIDAKRAGRYPPPYAGVLWISPHAIRTRCEGWGTAGDTPMA